MLFFGAKYIIKIANILMCGVDEILDFKEGRFFKKPTPNSNKGEKIDANIV